MQNTMVRGGGGGKWPAWEKNRSYGKKMNKGEKALKMHNVYPCV